MFAVAVPLVCYLSLFCFLERFVELVSEKTNDLSIGGRRQRNAKQGFLSEKAGKIEVEGQKSVQYSKNEISRLAEKTTP